MGIVCEAKDNKIKHLVILKFLPPVITRDPEGKKRFIYSNLRFQPVIAENRRTPKRAQE